MKHTVTVMYEIYTGKKSAISNILNGGVHGELVNALKAEELVVPL